MSTHDEAELAMACLTDTLIEYVVRLAEAIHQDDISVEDIPSAYLGRLCKDRKVCFIPSFHTGLNHNPSGFMDGVNHAIFQETGSHERSYCPKPHEMRRLISSDSSDPPFDSYEADAAFLAISPIPTTSLLVANLPTILFSQAQDLHPLLFPFGDVETLKIADVSPPGTISVVVQYSQVSVAQEAKECLSGQRYGTFQIEARYVKSPIFGLDRKCSALCLNLAQKPFLDPAGRP